MKLLTKIQILPAVGALFLCSCATMAPLDSKSDAALQAMSDKLASADQLSFTAYRTIDPQLVENPGQISNAMVDVQVARPDRAKAVVKGGGDERHIYLTKEGSAIYSPKNGYYARFNGYGKIETSVDAIAEDLDIHVPMQDFLGSNPYRDFRVHSDSISFVGVEQIGGVPCDVIEGKRTDLSWRLWIAQSDHLPRQATISNSELKGKDHWRAVFKGWNLNPSLPNGTFEFNPPKSATEIDILVSE